MIELHMHHIQTWMRCQKKFEYSVYRGFEPETSSEAIRRGSCVHALLAAHFRAEPQDEVTGRLSQDPQYTEIFQDSYDVYRRYLTEVATEDRWEVLSVEQEYAVELKKLGVRLLLRPDLVIKDLSDDRIKILDFKTTQQFPANQKPEMDMDVQMLTYSWAWDAMYGVIPQFVYEYIRKQMPARPETRFHCRISMQRSHAELIHFEHELSNILELIREVFNPVTPLRTYRSIIHTGGESCGTCPFLAPCMAELLQGRKLPDDTFIAMGYKKGDGCSKLSSQENE